MTKLRRLRTTPEWVTFVVAVAVIAVLLGLLVVQIVGSSNPARPVVSVVSSGIGERDGAFVVPVEVTNEGDRGAQALQLSATLTTDDTTTSVGQTIDFLGAGETVDAVFMFADDPRQGQLEVTVDGFLRP